MVQIPKLISPRFVLRPFREGDVEELHGILQNPDVLRYFPSTNSPSLPKVKKLVESQQAHWDEHEYGWWAIADSETDALLGWCGLCYLPDTKEVELKYLLAEDAWGKGIATEASLVSLKHWIMNTDVEEIVGLAHPENIASARVLEKVGMTFINQTRYFGMQVLRYKLLRRDYEEA